jgi:hypothetical protein
MWSRTKILELLLGEEHEVDAPARPDSAPRTKAKPAVGSQEWYKQLPPRRTDDGISMNELARRVKKPKPPRAPGQQERRFNGSWWFWI